MERITIVGAGLVGCVLSILLVKRGYKVTLIDRNADPRQESPRKNGKALNLTLCTRGLKSLDDLNLGPQLQQICVPAFGRCIHDVRGATVWQPYGNHDEALYSVQRFDLTRLLVAQVERHPEIDLRFNQKCTAILWSPLSVELKDVVTERTWIEPTDRIIAADGAFSAVRKLLQTGGRFNYSQEFLDQGYKEITFPEATTAEWTERRTALHMWPRNHFMLLGFPNTDGTFTCSLHMPFEGPTSFAALQSRKQIAAFFEQTFPDVSDHIPDLAEQFMNSPVNPMVSVRCSPWTVGNTVTLIGDAAHVLFPYYGQGANAGFEDCVFLMQTLDEAGGQWNIALQHYEQERKPNMDLISDLCKEHYVELRRMLADPLFVFRKRIERRVSEKYPQLFQPLYSMIAFTCMSYMQAVSMYKEQSQIIDRILASSEMNPAWNDARIDAAIDQILQPVGLAAAAFAQAQRA